MFFLLFRDMDSIYRFLILCIPILCVGILYENHGGWQIPIIFAILGCVLIYEVGRWKIIHYEWI